MGLLLKVKKDKMDQWEGFSCLCYTVNQETDIVEYARRKFLVLYLGVLMEQFIQPSYWEKERKSQWQKEETKGINLSLLRRKFLSVSYLWLSVEQELIVGRRKGQEFQSKNSKKKKKKKWERFIHSKQQVTPKESLHYTSGIYQEVGKVGHQGRNVLWQCDREYGVDKWSSKISFPFSVL